jgi:hypothetical protein
VISIYELAAGFHQALALWGVVLPAMLIGCLCGNLLVITPIWRHIEIFLRRAAEFIWLPAAGGPYLAMCFLNRYAANTMIAGLLERGEFPIRYLTSAFLAGWFPYILFFYVFYILPALVGAVGVNTTSVFSAFYLGINLMIALVGITLAARCSRQDADYDSARRFPSAKPVFNPKTRAITLLKQSAAQFTRIAMVFVPTTLFFALLLNHRQAAIWLKELNPVLAHLGLPSASVLVILAGLPSTVSGIAAVGTAFQSNLLSCREVVITLLIASCFHAVYEFFASFLPANLAIFGSTRGWRLSVATIAVRLAAAVAGLLGAAVIL